MYTETVFLPYMLNYFKLVGNHRRMDSSKYANGWYNTFDLWVEQRTPAELKAIISISLPTFYLAKYFRGKRPAFCEVFPNLRAIDLREGRAFLPSDPQLWWTVNVSREDLEGDLDITWPTRSKPGSSPNVDLVRALRSGPNHFDTVIVAENLMSTAELTP
jgi:hypothetical protein